MPEKKVTEKQADPPPTPLEELKAAVKNINTWHLEPVRFYVDQWSPRTEPPNLDPTLYLVTCQDGSEPPRQVFRGTLAMVRACLHGIEAGIKAARRRW